MGLSKKLTNEINKVKDEYKKNKNEKKTLDSIKKAIMEDKPKDRTITSRYSFVKIAFREEFKDKDFLKKIRPPDDLTLNIIKTNQQIRDNKRQVKITEEIINKILPLQHSNDPKELAIYLLFISGRRTSELLDADFINNKKKRMVGIKGVKKRGKNNKDEICNFKTITTKTKFFKLLSKFQNKKINRGTFPKLLLLRVKKILGQDFKPHDLRAIYISYLFKFDNKEMIKINPYIQKHLCHLSINSSLSYTGFSIDFNNRIKNI